MKGILSIWRVGLKCTVWKCNEISSKTSVRSGTCFCDIYLKNITQALAMTETVPRKVLKIRIWLKVWRMEPNFGLITQKFSIPLRDCMSFMDHGQILTNSMTVGLQGMWFQNGLKWKRGTRRSGSLLKNVATYIIFIYACREDLRTFLSYFQCVFSPIPYKTYHFTTKQLIIT